MLEVLVNSELSCKDNNGWRTFLIFSSLLTPHPSPFFALRLRGTRRRNAAEPGVISLRSITPAKAAYSATGIFFLFQTYKQNKKPPYEIFSKFHTAVTFLCYFLLVVAKESKYRPARPKGKTLQTKKLRSSLKTSRNWARVRDARQLKFKPLNLLLALPSRIPHPASRFQDDQ